MFLPNGRPRTGLEPAHRRPPRSRRLDDVMESLTGVAAPATGRSDEEPTDTETVRGCRKEAQRYAGRMRHVECPACGHRFELWLPPGRPRVNAGSCRVSDCNRPAKARGLCHSHWRRWRMYGDPEATTPAVADRNERDKKIRDLRRQGLTLAEIGRHFGLTRQRVQQILARAGEPPEHPPG